MKYYADGVGRGRKVLGRSRRPACFSVICKLQPPGLCAELGLSPEKSASGMLSDRSHGYGAAKGRRISMTLPEKKAEFFGCCSTNTIVVIVGNWRMDWFSLPRPSRSYGYETFRPFSWTPACPPRTLDGEPKRFIKWVEPRFASSKPFWNLRSICFSLTWTR